MRRRKRSCILSYNSCSHKKCHVKISTTYCSSLILCIRRCGTQRECGIYVIVLSRSLLQCFPQGSVRPLSLSVEHYTVHLAAIKQAILLNMKCSMAGLSRPRTVTVRLTSCSYLYLCFCCRGSGDGERTTHQS